MFQKAILLNQCPKIFLLEKSSAEEQVGNIVDVKTKKSLETSFPGYDIKINLESKNNIYRVYFENITDSYYIEELNNFVIVLLDTLHNVNKKKSFNKYSLDFNNCTSFNDSEKQYEEQNTADNFSKLNQYFESDEDLDNMEDMDLEDIEDMDLEDMEDEFTFDEINMPTVSEYQKMEQSVPKKNKIK